MYVVLDYLNIFHVLDRVVYLSACLPVCLPCRVTTCPVLPCLGLRCLSCICVFFPALSCLVFGLVLSCIALSCLGLG